MKEGSIGIAKRDIKKGEKIFIPIDCKGFTLPNDSINFLETARLVTKDGDLKIVLKQEKR